MSKVLANLYEIGDLIRDLDLVYSLGTLHILAASKRELIRRRRLVHDHVRKMRLLCVHRRLA